MQHDVAVSSWTADELFGRPSLMYEGYYDVTNVECAGAQINFQIPKQNKRHSRDGSCDRGTPCNASNYMDVVCSAYPSSHPGCTCTRAGSRLAVVDAQPQRYVDSVADRVRCIVSEQQCLFVWPCSNAAFAPWVWEVRVGSKAFPGQPVVGAVRSVDAVRRQMDYCTRTN